MLWVAPIVDSGAFVACDFRAPAVALLSVAFSTSSLRGLAGSDSP